jgi:predicted SAM-dependent methyltransferase
VSAEQVITWPKWIREYPDIVRILRLVRYEWRSWTAHWIGKAAPRQRTTLKSLHHARGLKLNIASGGTNFPGWLNIDASSAADIRMDLRRCLPLPNGSVSLIFCEHFCDHLEFPTVISRFLAECHRVLEPGGRARFVLHDAEDLVRAYLDRDVRYFDIAEETTPTLMQAVNKLFRFNDSHQFLYDYETFEKLLREAGFARVIRCSFRQSEIAELARDYDLPSREVMSMYVEAIRAEHEGSARVS